MTKAIIKGLNAVHLPGMVQISSNNLHLSNPEVIAYMMREFLKGTDTPVGLHLDHGKSFDDVKACVDAGFTSIMVDASHLNFEENIKEVKKTVEYCHFYHVPVEAELGAIMGKEDDDVNEADCKTDPALVKEFVERSGCDILAVSIGNVHGLDAVAKIDLALLKRIAEVSPVPLVLHGGSGIPFDQVKQMRDYNMIKVNYGSDLRRAFIQTFGEAYEKNHNEANLYGLSAKAVENVSKTAADLVLIINGLKES
ncbi:MAG: class II aldolase [Clostridium sp.]